MTNTLWARISTDRPKHRESTRRQRDCNWKLFWEEQTFRSRIKKKQ